MELDPEHRSVGNTQIAFFPNLGFAFAEIVGGFLTNSLAILSDAIHDLGDSLTLGLSWYLEKRSKQAGSKRFSYGLGRLSLLGALILAAVVALLGLSRPAAGAPASAAKVSVVASFYPLAEFAGRVGGERVTVRNLVPAGAEPHDYELTPRDVVAISQARVLFYNGVGLEPWVQKLLPQLAGRVIKVNASEGIPLMRLASATDRGLPDPHVWLDPLLARRQVENVLAGLARADPAGRATYEDNAVAFKVRLAALHGRIQRTLGPCRNKVFVVSHAAFGYFAARYGLTQVAISGLAPEAEPSAAKIREILRLVRQHNLRVIYYETLVSPRVAEAIAREVGARTLVLNPIEGLTDAELRQGKDYLSVMDENVQSLAQGLDCQ